ncbi:hypothetical protein B9G54_01680 [Alloscardovia macacae]|uniref:SF3 helicase domain-containing protein n=1 Tax=Alloscardovia macacae TaxID=1160091 RepID=A0A1Y2SVQ9_9BIFI|nr:bifunctional DNA primase/polymerase [Alloscardovia macacae]OTA27256.1 hypothetical protein B9G54_01680 [Alloscardovia macacae]OTA29266.1 hypothetical protein B9T39_03875 [Alloscardovia macacae]
MMIEKLPSDYIFSSIPDGPQTVQGVYDGLSIIASNGTTDTDLTFTDRLGRKIHMPAYTTRRSVKPLAADGYCKAVWDFKNGDMLLGEDGTTLYVRDVDRSGANKRLDSWHAISSLENEYRVAGRETYSPWNDQLRVECQKKRERVRHGVKFTDRAFLRFNGQICSITADSPYFSEPFEVTFDRAFDTDLVGQAVSFLRDVTVDDKSAKNLCRLFATPLLEPYKHLTYVLYGDGGNGKGILLNTLASSLPGLTASVDSQKILGGRRGSGGFDTQQEMGKLIGALWAFDEDADTISLEQLTALKKISTGDSVTARRIQENAVSFAPKCTFVVATNNPVVTTMTNAIARRFVYVRMKDGRKASEFEPLLTFRKDYGIAPFLMASCLLWENEGDEPEYDVSIGSVADLSEAEQWLVDEICENEYAVSARNPYPETAREHKNSISKLGLKTSRKRVDALLMRVLIVADERRFAPYRAAWEADTKKLEEEAKPVAVPAPLDAVGRTIEPDSLGFECDYVPARANKVADNWKKLAESATHDTSSIPDSKAYAVVPKTGYIIIDCDTAKTEGEMDGWESLQWSIGPYGSDSFPETYLVRTPSGGVHAYYKLPDDIKEHVLNKVQAGGQHIDLRVGGRGYVIGAGSETNGGVYQLCDLPDGERVPEITLSMIRWLNDAGCIEDTGKTAPTVMAAAAPTVSATKPAGLARHLARGGRQGGSAGGPQIDMSPIPKGQRNQQLHDWLYGRMLNHPDNIKQITDQYYERGKLSGLGQAELDATYKSVSKTLGYQS